MIGPSGSGKSSVVFAGLIPGLRAEGIWLIDSFRPQSQPFYGLASALVRLLKPELDEIQQPGRAAELLADMAQGKLTLPQAVASILERHPTKRLLLVVDQFEELYTLSSDREQERFVDALLAAVHSAPRRLTLVLTLRADFLSYVLNYPPFGEAFRQHTPQFISAMNRGQMLSAIECPAQKMGVKLEKGLTERILDEVKQEPGNLPLLEFALTQLWAKQSQRQLTHQAYTEIGGVAKALANHAEAVYAKLNEIAQKQVQRIFLQLICPGEGTEDTRRLATRAEVEDWELVTFLAGAEARLVVTGRNEQTEEETVEVVHEALIREWRTLQGWMKAERTFRTWQERLRAAKERWKATGKDEGALLRGFLLDEAKDWRQKRLDELSQEERDFIQGSLALRDREIKEQESQQQRITIARTLAICFLIAFLSLVVFFFRDRIKLAFISANRKHLAESNLAKSYLPGVDWSDGNLSKAKLREADLTGANLSKANLRGADFWKTYMPGANLSQADLCQANLSQANLTGGDLSKAKLNKAQLVETYMPQAHLQDTDLSQADLSQANLSGGNLSRANLKGAQLVETYMPQAHLQDTDLSQADLSQADLTGGDLSRANLKGARLVKTFMLKTNLQHADLSGADLQGAQNLNPDQVKRAKNWEQAKYDKDFRKQLGLTGSPEAK